MCRKKRLSWVMTLVLLATTLLPASLGLAQEGEYSLMIDNSAWKYNAEDDVYWQVGLVYCIAPETTAYESLGIFVPATYLAGTNNGDNTYTCAISEEGTINGYTAQTAPIVIPVNTPGYSAMAAPTGYVSGISSYINAGFVYVSAGCRGRDNGYNDDGTLAYNGGAPWGVTDLKAAVRYLRYNSDALAGDTDRIFTFGHSGGGAQSALMGATGDSELYTPYLQSIGAALTDAQGDTLSDAIFGAMCWCPITSLDTADQAYEWNMGQYADGGTRAEGTWTSALSDDLSTAFAGYINELGLVDGEGLSLTLEASAQGIYAAGSYYDYLLAEIERSLNNFLSDTTFPYTSGGGMTMPEGGFPGGGDGPGGEMPDLSDLGDLPEGEVPDFAQGGGPGGMTGGPGGGSRESVTYDTVQDYIDSLNSDEDWVTYDPASNTAIISSVEAFVLHCKNASKSVGAFDDLNRAQAENQVFGTAEHDALHFDITMAGLINDNQQDYAALSDWDASYPEAYATDLTYLDALGNGTEYRQNMYNPMYYLEGYYEGNGTSNVATHWRVHSGIDQGDTALTVEMNLALALAHNANVEDVAFEMVWGQGHTMAERTGNSTDNFIAWVVACCPQN